MDPADTLPTNWYLQDLLQATRTYDPQVKSGIIRREFKQALKRGDLHKAEGLYPAIRDKITLTETEAKHAMTVMNLGQSWGYNRRFLEFFYRLLLSTGNSPVHLPVTIKGDGKVAYEDRRRNLVDFATGEATVMQSLPKIATTFRDLEALSTKDLKANSQTTETLVERIRTSIGLGYHVHRFAETDPYLETDFTTQDRPLELNPSSFLWPDALKLTQVLKELTATSDLANTMLHNPQDYHLNRVRDLTDQLDALINQERFEDAHALKQQIEAHQRLA